MTTSHPMSSLLNEGCSECHIHVINEESLMDHLAVCKKRYLYNCSSCGFGSQCRKLMLIHVVDHHPDLLVYFHERAKTFKKNSFEHESLLQVLCRNQRLSEL
jgi:hypothetical protein